MTMDPVPFTADRGTRGRDGSQLHGWAMVLVSVADRGRGFAPDVPDCVFDRFVTTKPEGMGLGLSMSRTIVEQHGGRLWASANTPHGATLSFTLPVASG